MMHFSQHLLCKIIETIILFPHNKHEFSIDNNILQ